MTAHCWLCGRPRGPSPDGLGSHCRRKLATRNTTTRTSPAAHPVTGQLPLEEHMTTDTTTGYHRAALINELDGGMCDDCDSPCPRCDNAREQAPLLTVNAHTVTDVLRLADPAPSSSGSPVGAREDGAQ